MSDAADRGHEAWDRRRADHEWRGRLEKRLEEIAGEVKDLRDDRLARTARNKVWTQVLAIAASVLGVLWLLVQLARVYLHGL